MGGGVGRSVEWVLCQAFSFDLSSKSTLYDVSLACLRLWKTPSSSQVLRIPAWSELTDASQSVIGGVRASVATAAQLCQTRSSVLGHSDLSPLQVISLGTVASSKDWDAAQVSNPLICGEGDQPLGDHLGECRLKSPTKMVGTVGSRSREVSVERHVLSSMSW